MKINSVYEYRLFGIAGFRTVNGMIPNPSDVKDGWRINTGRLILKFDEDVSRYSRLDAATKSAMVEYVENLIGGKITSLYCRVSARKPATVYIEISCIAPLGVEKPALEVNHEACIRLAKLRESPKVFNKLCQMALDNLSLYGLRKRNAANMASETKSWKSLAAIEDLRQYEGGLGI